VPMDGVVLINPLTFFFKEEEHTEGGEHAVTGETTRYLRRLRDPEAWRKLLNARVDLRVPARTLTRFVVKRLRGRAQELARRAGLAVGDDLAHELKTVTGRHTALRFVFSAGDPGLQRVLARVEERELDPLSAVRQIMEEVFELDGADDR